MAKLNLPTCVPQYATANCSACRLNRESKLQLAGGGKRRVLVLLEKQHPIQQATKTYMRGDRYTYIRDLLAEYGLSTDDYWITSTIQCFADSPTQAHATHCRPNIIKLIQTLKPELVLCFGEFTATTLLQEDIVDGDGTKLDRVHGFVHPNRQLHCGMMFTYNPHPSLYEFNRTEDMIIRRDVYIAMQWLHKPKVWYKDEMECVRILSPTDAVAEMQRCIADRRPRFSALDYETTALKPYNANSRLLSCAICEDVDDSFAFLIDDTTAPVLRDYWRTQHITKIAHNSAFERAWTIVKLGVMPYKLIHDTMLMAHGLDNRDTRWLSIKFLAPMLTGCALWNKHIEAFLESSGAAKAQYGEYALNRASELPVRQLLTYNAIDSLVELRVFHLLREYMLSYYDTFPNKDTIESLTKDNAYV